MAETQTDRHRSRTTALVVLTLLLGVFAFLTANRAPPVPSLPAPSVPVRTTSVEFARFSALWERSPDGERLHVSLRLRTNNAAELPCFVFVLARNDRTTPKAWAIWPPQPPGPVVTFGGHFLGTDPGQGHAVTLTGSWERVSAILPHPAGQTLYDTVLVYVMGENGKIFLARPFRV